MLAEILESKSDDMDTAAPGSEIAEIFTVSLILRFKVAES